VGNRNHISGTGTAEASVIKFCIQEGYKIPCSIWRTNHPEKGHALGHVTHLQFCRPNDISVLAQASRQILYTGRLYHIPA